MFLSLLGAFNFVIRRHVLSLFGATISLLDDIFYRYWRAPSFGSSQLEARPDVDSQCVAYDRWLRIVGRPASREPRR